MSHCLGDLARQVGAQLHGDSACKISHVDTIQDASAGALCFLTNKKYRKYLAATGASAVVLSEEYLEHCPVNALVSDNPYLIYARIAALLNPRAEMEQGRHPSAVVSDQAQVDEQTWIGPCAVVEAGAIIAAGAFIGPGCIIGRDCKIGTDSRLVANITLCHGSEIGSRVLIHPGAVLGSDGFGLADDQGVWVKVPQLGNVRLGDDVEIGANTTIDRGALGDTVIENGVKLDNQIQIAHNVRIGEHTAIAACTGIAGSTSVGSSCTLGGGVGVVGHLEIGDNVHFSAQTLVTRSFKEPGFYSGSLPAVPNSDWRRTIAQVRRLDDVVARLKVLERQIKIGD
ncbi:UDP-3-O-(3-hydroxymyristoyl)glucosamine N-acyltransferase [Candidatus Vondammii sp. HM_W22]|uniref:UDP-3-O-(3-hydroxymyristoyl)glucosamine N-acyltransferase n=1 Tax=Candidatus Vondammii sp. HM_W22 TaxID=2687299 RepID=UPI001F13AC46|nr:UDP-3-O-(3-hydroxymyristoyl)glucosamine N-acyltransferase [Candidatus Vondammii sp. HM_W22]